MSTGLNIGAFHNVQGEPSTDFGVTTVSFSASQHVVFTAIEIQKLEFQVVISVEG